jgi:hypothetical protein
MMKFMFLTNARLLKVVCWVVAVLLSPAMALAADEDKMPDARIQNFSKPVSLPEGGTALTWLLLIFLTVICLAALFKNAKRTHLD